MDEGILRSGESLDDMGFGGIRIIQKRDEFCYGVDAVLLADFAGRERKEPGRIIDLGAGTGAVSLILSHKYPQAHIVEAEIQRDSADRAVRSAALNMLDDRIEVICGDITELPDDLCGTFDTAVSNPPYMESGAGPESGTEAKNIARRETTAGLIDFLAAAAVLLKENGSLYMVHRPYRLADIISFARIARLEPKEIRFVYPFEGQESNIVLIRFVKGGGKELHVCPPLYVREKDGRYTEEIDIIYERKK
ncbi:MAG: tRNA1(Val) (adenine(37)-N6)-methyltransferase [Eubacteriaceae bacterium]|jgi:tRNA1(Val) A37 N6-methylase TrmN6|nr:tRNA1(Val) (adenine(37)-N6)-methyltransferase [Eubacteriaceae bacterium]